MLKKVVNCILSLLLTISLFLLVITFVIFNTIGNKKYTLKMLDKNNYYNSVYSDIKSNIKGYTIQLGIDDTVLDSLYSKEKVRNDVNILISGIYDNKDIVIDTTDITNKLEEIINNKLKENNRNATSDEKIAIEKLKEDVASVYESEITYSTKYALKLRDAYSKINNYKNILLCILSGISIFLLLLIIFINKNIKNIIKNIGITLLSVSFLLIAIKLLLNSRFQNILILNSIFSKLVIFIINNIFNTYFIIGIILGIIGIISIVLGVSKKKLNKIKK